MERCARCGEWKDEDEFNWREKAIGRRQSLCRVCSREQSREFYERNQEAEKARNYVITKERRTARRSARQLGGHALCFARFHRRFCELGCVHRPSVFWRLPAPPASAFSTPSKTSSAPRRATTAASLSNFWSAGPPLATGGDDPKRTGANLPFFI